jgi:hypothetical protein
MVTVHYFRVYDVVHDRMVTQALKSPAERIKRIGGEIIPGTAEEVEDEDLDEHGRYAPRPASAEIHTEAAEPPPLTGSDRWLSVMEPLKAKVLEAVDKAVATNREKFREHIGPRAVALLGDDDLVTKVAEQIYPVLPFALRMVVKEDAFAAFLLKHREPLIAALAKA